SRSTRVPRTDARAVRRCPRLRAAERTALEPLGLQQERDHEREDAKALRERGEDDRVRADETGRVGVTADRLRGLRAEDPDTESRAENAETDREASAEPCEIHAWVTS